MLVFDGKNKNFKLWRPTSPKAQNANRNDKRQKQLKSTTFVLNNEMKHFKDSETLVHQ